MTEKIAPLPQRQRAVQAALGKIPFDRLLINANVIDMVTGEIREADVGITGNMIASVHPRGKFSQAENVDDLTGRYLSPGLIDTHVHIESSHLSPEKYAEIVVAQGTTTVFWIRMNWQTCWASPVCGMQCRRAAICLCE